MILLFVESWWWVAPAAAGAGAATYAGVTARGRRARRLELDAARRELSLAYHALILARVRVREAQANVLSARAVSGSSALGDALMGTPATVEARRQLQEAKRSEKAAVMTLRAGRARVKATTAQYHAASSADPLPIEKLFATQDAVVARWMAYETDDAKAIAYPQLSDTRYPATLAFFRAYREAQRLRPASARDRIPPEQFLEYRDAVRTLEAAFDEAERQAGAAESRPAPRTSIWPVPAWRPLRLPTSD
ncbi:hypothetical protein SAMN04487846_0294 [Microbacterium sp. cf046]|nr:hypothetical protein SAMN04487846_0294 [Microbacterium sp. cf046]